jgi:hypothetical protein
MDCQRAHGPSAEEYRESDVLALLLDSRSPSMWSMSELGRELGDLAAADAVTGLCAAGLVHRFDDFVFASRSATHFSRLSEGP